MSTLTRDQILDADDLAIEGPIEIEEWDGEVYLREMSAKEREEYENEVVTGDPQDPEVNTEHMRARLLVRALCDEDGERLFETDDMEALSERSADVLGRLFERAQRLSGLAPDQMEAAVGN